MIGTKKNNHNPFCRIIVRMLKMILLFPCLLVLASCSVENLTQSVDLTTTSTRQLSKEKDDNKLKIAIFYFSRINNIETSRDEIVTGASIHLDNGKRIGNTETLANWIAEKNGAKLYPILVKNPYPNNYDRHIDQVREELNNKVVPELEGNLKNIYEYDIIFLGYPIWLGEIPPPVLSFLETYDLSNKTIIPFITSGGTQDVSNTVQTIEENQPKAIVMKYFFTDTSRLSTERASLEKWLNNVEQDYIRK